MISEIKSAIAKFVRSEAPGVLLVKGRWGSGKTHYWNRLIPRLARDNKIRHEYYAYVSLFGVNSIEELQDAVFIRRQKVAELRGDSDDSNWLERAKPATEQLKELGSRLTKLPWFRNYTGTIPSALAFLAVRDTLVCLDDYERKGNSLGSSDVLGFISLLKDQRDCKVVLILNDDALAGPERVLFRRDIEKIVDAEIAFRQTPAEACACEFGPDDPYHETVRRLTESVGLTNIRILQKIKARLLDLAPLLQGSRASVAESVVTSLFLFTWSYNDQEKTAPPFDFILNFGLNPFLIEVEDIGVTLTKSDEDADDPETHWRATLRSVDYMLTDDLDRTIADYVANGYAPRDSIAEMIAKRNVADQEKDARAEYSKAWELYRSSFDDNEDEFIEQLLGAFRSNMSLLDARNLQTTVEILRELGQDEEAEDLVDDFVECHISTPSAFDLARTMFTSDVDSYLLSAFSSATETLGEEKTLFDVANRVVFAKSWGEDDSKFMAAASVQEYYDLFTSTDHEDLPQLVRGCLKFSRFANPSDESKQIGHKSREALRMIASENRLNAVRIRNMFGLRFD